MDEWTRDWPRKDAETLNRALEPGEALRWAGRPDAARHARKYWLRIFGGLPFFAFGLFLTVVSLAMIDEQEGSGWAWFPIVGAPFLVAGLIMMASPLWAWFRAANSLYAVTDRRALIIDRRGAKTRSFAGKELARAQIREVDNHLTDVVIHERLTQGADGAKRMTDVGFFCVMNGKGALAAMQALADHP